jgi:hypothetical protein
MVALVHPRLCPPEIRNGDEDAQPIRSACSVASLVHGHGTSHGQAR